MRPERRLIEALRELDKGEIEVLALAKMLKAEQILIDDATGRSVAKGFGFCARGTLHVLLKACKNGMLSKKDAKDLMDELVHAGFRVSLEVYVSALRELERLE